MINYFYENVSPISDEDKRAKWLENLILDEGKKPGDINYILCDDEYLLEINKQYLDHDYYTDIITFDYCKGKIISGDIFLSLQRVLDNASMLETKQEEELNRVLAHGILHLCGYKDKTEEEQKLMRSKEDFYIGKY
ncbi:rRNA maturation RNase YbeY [Elizabethkingia meningoseptica]|uniref:rRNA maturation RNase YbeY n=1 Tax=Elizabethkingia meningoseptica TaxID=238 RepID=UPI00099A2270|nr:rRNA maturation RNase YbeY [Elizabethkingia meningoseptica]EJK5328710.1 rRNA maturation RNase YbeY [Elizabethkingia meningoseptica]MDE5438032.1 rRNA maturation RNase YbeY [Elizabethkingia meningoseptica]MDE5450639.1 rRNA maturation RNase YbeY [Elizabethkingia meningoseptica]MDE5468489.1 rRNA maturation RNase YbeY [Elizabethkingia meningoseptica]MDE5475458.1 rRNA maturation RNase YbeY [Elizabethkingia meningoseptica]